MGRQVTLFLGASSSRIKALRFRETIEKAEPAPRERERERERAAPPPPLPALAQGHWAIQPWNICCFSADRTPVPSIQMSATAGCNSRLLPPQRKKRSAPTGLLGLKGIPRCDCFPRYTLDRSSEEVFCCHDSVPGCKYRKTPNPISVMICLPSLSGRKQKTNTLCDAAQAKRLPCN